MAKILTRCQVGSLGTEMGQSIFGCLIGYILKTCFIGIFPYEYSLQLNLNHSIPISYVNFMTKIPTAYHKSAFLKLYFLDCSLAYLTHQFLLDSKHFSNIDTYMNIIPSPIGITSIRYQTKTLSLKPWLLVMSRIRKNTLSCRLLLSDLEHHYIEF